MESTINILSISLHQILTTLKFKGRSMILKKKLFKKKKKKGEALAPS